MRFDSPRVLGLVASGLVLAGWLLGSTLSPPVAMTQTRDVPRPTPQPLPEITPVRNLAASTLQTRPPAPSRNPFAFGGTAMAAAVPGETTKAAEPTRDLDAVPAPPALPTWRLVGVAVGADGAVTAVLSGAGDVHLARVGDRLPGEIVVIDVTADGAQLQRPDGSTVSLRLP
jgi:Tfp pilus assembly protein PilP